MSVQLDLAEDAVHLSCSEGIIDPSMIADFLSDVRRQKTPEQVGLYDLVVPSDDGRNIIGQCGVIYGFFEEEPNVVIRMDVYSFSDQAYSVKIEGKEYVLPEKWVERLNIH